MYEMLRIYQLETIYYDLNETVWVENDFAI